MLEGKWCGAGSAAAFLQALDPALPDLECNPPALVSDRPAAPEPALAAFDPETQMPRQSTSWTCSACSLSWVLRALRSAPDVDESQAVTMIGSPANINATYGLMDSSGAQIRRVLADHGLKSSQNWLSFDQAYTIYATTPGCMSGAAWYHWVAVRGVRRRGVEHCQLCAGVQRRFFDAVARAVQRAGAVFVYLDHEVRALLRDTGSRSRLVRDLVRYAAKPTEVARTRSSDDEVSKQRTILVLSTRLVT